jgi:alkylhydroperoxidase family enzyme
MPWISQVPVAEATGALKVEFDAALARAGRVWNIVHVMSLNPFVMRQHTGLYKAIMHGPSPLSRRQREMVATVVSKTIGCHY